jgi:hypothetical protein
MDILLLVPHVASLYGGVNEGALSISSTGRLLTVLS